MRMWVIGLLLVAAGCAEVGGPVAAGASSSSSGFGGASSSSTSSSSSGSGGGIGFGGAGSQGGGGGAPACVQQEAQATAVAMPIDLLVLIDNSGSMGEEIAGVQSNLNQHLAKELGDAGVDYRVIMFTRHGALSDEAVCIEAPLSSVPSGGCSSPNGPPAKPGINPPRFFHYSFNKIGSRDSLCQLLSRYGYPDDLGLAPEGWKQWLRPEAFKIFLEVSDDGVDCTYNNVKLSDAPDSADPADGLAAAQQTAAAFEAALLNLSTQHFGTAAMRKYRWFSLVGLAPKNHNKLEEPWLPALPISLEPCEPGSEWPGLGYQALSILSGGLRFPLCKPNYYNVMFKEIAKGVIDSAAVPCEYEIPAAPPGQIVDLSSVVVRYTPGDGGPAVDYQQAPSVGYCAADKFTLDQGAIKLCPGACIEVSNDLDAKISVMFDCVGAVY